jgi:hypothetical protein
MCHSFFRVFSKSSNGTTVYVEVEATTYEIDNCILLLGNKGKVVFASRDWIRFQKITKEQGK